MAKLRAFFRYFGGKKEAARYYPHPRFKVLIEPFAGSAGYSVTHYTRDVRLYDVSQYICGVWDMLIHIKQSDFDKIPLIPQYNKEKGGLCQEIRWFLGFWFQSGLVKPARQPSGWSVKNERGGRGRTESTWDQRTRSCLAKQLKFIRHWTIDHKSYKDVDNEQATWFVDPPYRESGTEYLGYKGLSFRHLSQWSQEREGQVIVCEEEGANWLPFQSIRACAGLSGKSNKEVVYYQ